MVSGLRHFRRIVSVTRTLARHDALFLFERDGFPRKGPFFIRLLMLAPRISGMSSRPEGERLAAALTAQGPSVRQVGPAVAGRPGRIAADARLRRGRY